jgi:hypothetical protein
MKFSLLDWNVRSNIVVRFRKRLEFPQPTYSNSSSLEHVNLSDEGLNNFARLERWPVVAREDEC